MSGAWQLHIYNIAGQKLKQLIFVCSVIFLIVIIVSHLKFQLLFLNIKTALKKEHA